MALVQGNIFLGDCTANSVSRRPYYIQSKKSQYPTKLEEESSILDESTSLQNSSYTRNFVIEGSSILGTLLEYKKSDRWRYGSFMAETYSSKHTPRLDSILTDFDLNKISEVLLNALALITENIKGKVHTSEEINKLSYRKEEIKWIEQNKNELKNYVGKWICIEGNRLIASNRNMKKLVRLISKQKIKKPFVYFVPNEQDSKFMGI